MKTITSISISFFLLLGGCTKTVGPSLPPIAHTGQNMFAYKVNGNIVSIYNSLSSLITFSNYSSGQFDIYGSTSNPDSKLDITFQYNNSVGIYPILFSYPYKAFFLDNTNGVLTGLHTSANYNCDSIHNGNINIIFYDGNELAGYFQFDAISDSGKIVHITDGRFDVYKH